MLKDYFRRKIYFHKKRSFCESRTIYKTKYYKLERNSEATVVPGDNYPDEHGYVVCGTADMSVTYSSVPHAAREPGWGGGERGAGV